MKILGVPIVILMVAAGLVMAEGSSAQEVLNRTVSMEAENEQVSSVLSKLEKAAKVRFTYVPEIFPKSAKTTLRVQNEPLEKVLIRLLAPYEVDYQLTGNYIILKKAGTKPGSETGAILPGHAQSKDVAVSGKVTDDKGEGLPGVSIILKGTQRGTTTDIQGDFVLNVPEESSVLVFSFVGYLQQEVSLQGRAQLTVQLMPEDRALSEVIVVGYGTQKKVSMTSAVSAVKGEELLRRPVSNLAQNLQGITPGLTIVDNGGGPGQSNVTIRVRGITTLSGDNNPLVIVDGIEQRYSDINPDDVESISVLKDASSTAIYGSRAANGVLMITTKRAQSGKIAVNYHGFYASQRSNNNPEHMELEPYMRMQNIAYQNVGSPAKYTEAQIQEYVNATDRYKYPLPYTMAEAVLRAAPQINNSLSISGGNENFKTRVSLRYQDQQGIIPNSQSDLTDIRINTDFKVSSKINFGADINYKYVASLAPSNEFKVFERLKHGSIWTVPKYPDGTYGISAQGENALMYAEINGTNRIKNDYVTGSLKAGWDIIDGLNFTSQFAVRKDMVAGKLFFNAYTINDYYDKSIVRKTVPLSSLTESRQNSQEFTWNNLLTYTKTAGNHSVTALLGYSQIERNAQNLSAYRQGFYNNDIQSISQGVNDATKSNDGFENQWGLRSYFSRLNYAYKDKYLFEANARYDGSSRFTGSKQYSFFPSFSGGWRISEERFWNGLSGTVNELKFRGSWGKTGNQAVALYSYYPTLNLATYSFNGVPVQGYVQRQMTNEDISWETTTQHNIGTDVQLFGGRISATIDYYKKLTDGILLVLPVPGTLGLQPTAQNAGVVENKGWEFSLGGRGKIGPVKSEINFNYSINNNNVKNLAGTGPYITGAINEARYITAEGMPINSFWGYKAAGLFQTQEEVDKAVKIGEGIKPGDVKYLDLNSDGKIDAGDMTYLGRSFPKYLFGSSMSFEYKGFSLNLLLQGAAGVKTNLSGALGDYGNLEGFAHKIYTNNYWTPENPGARFPRPTKFDVRNTYQNDREMLNATYLRLKNIQLRYQIPSDLTRRISLDRVAVYVSGTNLLTFSALNEWNIDPESLAGRVQDYPQTSLLTLGLNIQF
ncbi:TonB-dependent receptor [Dyadobacter aurulentus]|uniref:TonB-dependent receptor n=1 Tax=Dyadobacter sp. UC 10 TaxID=2605428 RepID=UPI001788BE77|nr:TonB-dependent receptor [Dyadobacter sp. UC 10]